MSVFLTLLNWLAVGLLCLARSKHRPVRILDPGWAFLIGYFLNYCVRPVIVLLEPDLEIGRAHV